MANSDTHLGWFSGIRWERGEADEEDVEIYGEVEVWELIDYGVEPPEIIETCFDRRAVDEDQYPVRKEDKRIIFTEG